MGKTIYVAGPMTGYEWHNFPSFDIAKMRLEQMGWTAISPADLDRAVGINEQSTMAECLPKMAEMMKADVLAILEVDAMFMLKGWERSTGARAEHGLAVWRGIPIFYQETI